MRYASGRTRTSSSCISTCKRRRVTDDHWQRVTGQQYGQGEGAWMSRAPFVEFRVASRAAQFQPRQAASGGLDGMRTKKGGNAEGDWLGSDQRGLVKFRSESVARTTLQRPQTAAGPASRSIQAKAGRGAAVPSGIVRESASARGVLAWANFPLAGC